MSQPSVSLAREPSLLDYTHGRRLGKGGQGVVHQYIDRQTGSIFAVKVIEFDIDELNPQARLQSEINILRESYVSPRLAHAHLLRAHEVFEYEEGFAIVMPYFHRGSLRQNPPRLSELKEAIRQILEALRHLHERGQIHRDIKPDNVLVRSEKGQPLDLVIADYGLISLDNPVSFCGSPGYAAPEVVRNGYVQDHQRRRYSGNVDVYALGMLILDILSVDIPKMWIQNRRQFNRHISATIAEQLDACDPGNFERYGALSTVDSMLRFDPSDRPSVDDCLRFPWLSGPIETPLAAQLAGAASTISLEVPQPGPQMKTWWHSDPHVATQTQQASPNRQPGGRYDLRKRRQTERHHPLPAAKKNRIQKRQTEALPTPRLTPDKRNRAQEPETPGSGLFRSGLAVSPSNTDQMVSQESKDLLSWDKMELTD